MLSCYRYVKVINAFFVCLIYKVGWNRKISFGRGIKIVNGKNIFLGKNIFIRSNTDLFANENIFIGNNCDIGVRNRIVGDVVIEDNVLIGPNNYIASVDHEYRDVQKPVMDQGGVKLNQFHDEILIKEGSWIGTNVAIIGCVHIGKHSVIGANTVVNKDVPDYSVVVGNPAKIVKYYDFEKSAWVRL